MKMYVKLPGQDPALWDVPADLPTLQHIVGGYIEMIPILSDLLVIDNEEGRLLGQAPNCEILGMYLVGPIILAGYKGSELADIRCDEKILRRLLPDLWEG